MGDVGSVQRSLRLPGDVAAAVAVLAEAEQRSFSQMVLVLLSEALGGRRMPSQGVVEDALVRALVERDSEPSEAPREKAFLEDRLGPPKEWPRR